MADKVLPSPFHPQNTRKLIDFNSEFETDSLFNNAATVRFTKTLVSFFSMLSTDSKF